MHGAKGPRTDILGIYGYKFMKVVTRFGFHVDTVHIVLVVHNVTVFVIFIVFVMFAEFAVFTDSHCEGKDVFPDHCVILGEASHFYR